MTKAGTIHAFWASFGLPAYEENSVPDSPAFPYIHYSLATDSLGADVAASASLWYRSESWLAINAKAEEIGAHIDQLSPIKCGEGRIWIKRGIPFAQNMGDNTDDLVKRKYLNIVIEYLTAH
jgi:hypothetical protein